MKLDDYTAHLSPSQLCMWIDSPRNYVDSYLGGIKTTSPAFWRGTAMGKGAHHLFYGGEVVEATAEALRWFDQEAAGEVAEDIAAERARIKPMMQSLSYWMPPGPLNATELRIEYWLDEIEVPVIGYIDFCFDDLDVELKSTNRKHLKPSNDAFAMPTPAHVWQCSLYRAARKRPGGLLYVTPTVHGFFPVTDEMVEQSLKILRQAASSLIEFLKRVDSYDDAIAILPRNPAHYAAKNQRTV